MSAIRLLLGESGFQLLYFANAPFRPTKKSKNGQAPQQREIPKIPEHGPGIWLVIPLLEKLPSSVRARIVKIAGQVMENTNFYKIYQWTEEDEESDEESEEDSDDSGDESDDDSDDSDDEVEEEPFYPQPPKLAYREFFNLILTCLKGHDEQRDILLTSLYKQLSRFVRGSQDVSVPFAVSLMAASTLTQCHLLVTGQGNQFLGAS